MKYFVIPADVELVNPGSKQRIATRDFASHARDQWLSDQRWYQPMSRLSRLVKVQEILEKPAKSEVFLEDSDWAILQDIITAPNMNNLAPNPMLQVQLMPFQDAVMNASEESHDARHNREDAIAAEIAKKEAEMTAANEAKEIEANKLARAEATKLSRELEAKGVQS